jgi:GT2 family glycosyltransferase/glycosyltransferase involved in cell wall biosynthesis
MEERPARGGELDAQIREIQEELRSLRGAIDQQNQVVSGLAHQLGDGLADIQNRISSLHEKSGKRGRSDAKAAGIRKDLEKAFVDTWIRCARVILRANVEDLFDRGFYVSLIPGLEDSGIDPVYHYLRHKSGISPHWLFDRDYYLATYKDVAAAKVDPLVHFLRSGWREGRNPHPLFDTKFYLAQAPELKSGNLNPVTHYLHGGWRRNLWPHPLMDGRLYLETYPDVVQAGMDPLSHYMLFGFREGRKPHKWFDTAFYKQSYPDVSRAGMEPLNHYVRYGGAENRSPHPWFDADFYREEYGPFPAGVTPLEHFVRTGLDRNLPPTQNDCVDRFLPATPFVPAAPRNRKIDIIIPAYRGLEETRACIESVLAAQNLEPFELVAIDDLSPEPALSDWLTGKAAEGAITLLRNESNLGFVASVNRGMSLHPDRDVVLLNSDTLVANDWLDRLVRSAYRADRIGTVTPLSNNATICSYPIFCEDNPLPPKCTAKHLDQLASEVNQGRSVDLPTAVGFCMFIRRECLRQTGTFDADTFGKGYGEENDFSLRAAALGWRNVLAADVFVYHSGSISFAGSAGLLRARSSSVLSARHPHYPALVSRHVDRDPARPYRFALTAARFRASGNPTVLLVTHGLGGGIGQHVEELVQAERGLVNFLELRPNGGSVFTLRFADPAESFSIRLDFTRQYDILIALLRSCNVSRIHIHHVLQHHLSFENLRRDLNVPMVFTVHDYFAICPRIVLADPQGRYCGEPDEAGCNKCIRETLPHITLDIASWRSHNGWLLSSADLVITPSKDAAVRMSRYFPAARIEAAVHPLQAAHNELPPVTFPLIEPQGVLRVAVLGVMSVHKGLRNLEACARLAKVNDLPLEFVLAGYSEPQVRDEGPFSFRETGEYERTDLPAVLAGIEPGLIWFPMRWPETFSYTLSVALEQGYAVMAPRLGALPERLSGRSWSWLYDWDAAPEALIALFLNIRDSMISGVGPQAPPARAQAFPNLYPDIYRSSLMRAPALVDLTEPGRLSVMAVLSAYDSGQLQSCGYIRAYLPLIQEERQGLIRLTVTSAQSALNRKADVLLVQRTAVSEMALAEELVRHCDRHGIRIVYETDDDLFQIDETHAESDYYKSRAAAAELIARHAVAVLVSSPVLKDRISHLNRNVRVIPNALDDALWFNTAGDPKLFRAESKTVRILYMGSMTHAADLELLEEPMRLLKAEFGERVMLDIIGITPDQHQRDWFNVIQVPGICGHSYPLFVEWLRQENRWDFAVAPLVDNAFNRCKSYIKYLDYGALGLPGVFPAIGVFENVVRQGKTGYCVEDAGGWYNAMRLLITNKKLRRELGHAAKFDVESNHTLGVQGAVHRELWTQIGNLPAVRSSSTMVSFSDDTAAISSKGI